MNPVLESVFRSGKLVLENGDAVKVHSETSAGQCQFLQSLISRNGCSRSLEIGLAFGLSAVAIAEGVKANGGRHLVIDKFQHAQWNGYGLKLIQMAGYASDVEFREKYCYEALADLLANGRQFDFVYIDSTKQFDWLMVDFFLIDRLLVVGGIVVFDDCGFCSIRRLIRYLTQYPHIAVEATYPENARPRRTSLLWAAIAATPGFRYILRESLAVADYKRGINSRCIALRKNADDSRSWDWYESF